MYKSIYKKKIIRRYMEAFALHNGAPTVNCEDKTIFISFVEAQIVTPRVKHIDIPVYFLQHQFDNGLFFPKYERSSVMPIDMCTKPCSDPIISWSNKWMNGFRFYPNIET